EDNVLIGLAICGDDIAALQDSIVIDSDIFAFGYFEEYTLPFPRRSSDIFKQIVSYAYSFCLTSRLIRRFALDVHSACTMPDDVVSELHILSRTPRRRAILIDRLEKDRIAGLTIYPAVLKQVSFNLDPLRVFQLKEV